MDLDEMVEASYPVILTNGLYYRILKVHSGRGGYELVIGIDDDNLTGENYKLNYRMLEELTTKVLLKHFGVRKGNLEEVFLACFYILHKIDLYSYQEIAEKLNRAMGEMLLFSLYLRKFDGQEPYKELPDVVKEVIQYSDYNKENIIDLSRDIFTLFYFLLLFLQPGRRTKSKEIKRKRQKKAADTLFDGMRNLLDGEPVWFDERTWPVEASNIRDLLRKWEQRIGPNWFEDMNEIARERTNLIAEPIRLWLLGLLYFLPGNIVNQLVTQDNRVTDYYAEFESSISEDWF